MIAVILAGGYGTRLRPLTYTRPKPMLPLLEKPVLQHIVEGLAVQGFNEIIVTTNYYRNQVIEHFNNGEAFGVKMIYPWEDTALGTAGSMKNAEEHLTETFAVVQGDGIADIQLNDAMTFHKEAGSMATLVLTPVDHPSEYGIVELDSKSRIARFREKPSETQCFNNLANTGIYILEPEILKYIPTNRKYDFANDLFPRLLAMGQTLYGYQAKGFWIDIGRPEKYMQAIRWALLRHQDTWIPEPKKVMNDSAKMPKTFDVGAEMDAEATIKEIIMIGKGCHIGKGVVFEGYSVIERDVAIGAGAQITNSVIYQGSHIGPSSHIDHSIVAEECHIGSHVKITASVVGAYCKVGDKAMIYPGSKIWPKSEINARSTIGSTIQTLNAR